MIAPSQGIPMAHGTLPLLYTFHFYLFGLIAVGSALLFVTRKSPVAAALWLVNTMFCLAALFVLLDAQFIGALQVLVYAGAIMVVFLFVIMLLNLGQSPPADIRGIGWKIAAGAVGIAHPRRRPGGDPREDAADAHAAHRVHGESGRDDRRRGADRRPAVQRVPVGVRDHQHPPFGGDRRRRRLGTPARRGPCSLRRSFSRPCCSRSASFGVLIRRNAIIVFMCVELMLNAVNLSFVAFAQAYGAAGQVFVFFVMTVAAAEAAVGLAIIIALFRHRPTVDLKNINLLKG